MNISYDALATSDLRKVSQNTGIHLLLRMRWLHERIDQPLHRCEGGGPSVFGSGSTERTTNSFINSHMSRYSFVIF